MMTQKQDSEIIEVEAEEIIDTLPVPTLAVQFAAEYKEELKKFDNLAAEIEKMKEEASRIEIKDIKDKEGREKARIFVAKARSLWVATEKIRKALKAPVLEVEDVIDSKAKWAIDEFKEVAKPFQERMDEIKAEEEKARLEKAAADDARFITRTQELLKLGVVFDAAKATFSMDGNTFSATIIRGTDDDIYDSIVNGYREAYEQKENARLQQERELKEQQETLQRQQALLFQQQEELRKQQAAQARQAAQDAMDRLNVRTKNRVAQLTAYGMGFDGDNYFYVDYRVSRKAVEDAKDSDWEEIIRLTEPIIEKRKKQREETERMLEEDRQRKAVEKAMEEKAEKDRVEQRRKEELIAMAGDKQKWNAILEHLKAIPVLKMKSSQYRQKLIICQEKLEEIAAL